MSHEFSTEVWLHEGDAAWHFLTVPEDVSDGTEVQVVLDLVDV